MSSTTLGAPVVAAAPHPPAESAARTATVAMLMAIALGVAVRGYLVFSEPLPLNDGGLFFAMSRDLQAAHYRLPMFTSYNGGSIPYAYPPLGFYLTALLDDLTPLSLLGAYRVIPFLFSSFCLLAFATLARRLLPRPADAAAATFVYALSPRSFIWLLMGGGVTRAPGVLFALLALAALVRFYRSGAWRDAVMPTVLAALSVLSHLGTAPFIVMSAVLLLLAYGRHLRAVLGSVLIGAGTLLLTAPWWGTLIGRFGTAPLRAAFHTGRSVFTDPVTRDRAIGVLLRLAEPLTSEPFFPVIGALAALGLVVCFLSRRWLLPAWVVIIALLDARQGATFASVPIALLAGLGLTTMLLPALRAMEIPDISPKRREAMRAVALAGLVAYAIAGAVVRRAALGHEGRLLRSLTPTDTAAMRWIGDHIPPTSQVLIVTGGANGWSGDRITEWFPIWSRRSSVATAQGYEWLTGGVFDLRKRGFERAQVCAGRSTVCLDSAVTYLPPFTHVYVSSLPDGGAKVPGLALIRSLDADPRYRRLFQADSLHVLYVRSGGAAQVTALTQPAVSSR